MPLYNAKYYPASFVELKRSIIGDKAKVTQAWADLLAALKDATAEYASKGPSMIPIVEFDQLETLETTNRLRRCGCVLIRNVVPDEEALSWKQQLREYVTDNPGVIGYPGGNKQFFLVYWSKPQVVARSHLNVVAAQRWLNKFWHPSSAGGNQDFMKGVVLDQPLTYADRFRIRNPGKWSLSFSPHIDGASIERWEDITLRKCFESILQGDWKSHDAFTLDGRVNALTDLYGRPNQSSAWRTWQGWLSMSSAGPGEGTIRFFPDLLLSTAYIILRPFFSPTVDPAKFESGEADIWDPKFWKFDDSKADFPGITPGDFVGQPGFRGPGVDEESHPHLKTNSTMCSAPHVNPGDMVFWHCDLLHSVETDHIGPNDSSVMYIPAVPTTPNNLDYIKLQKEHFIKGLAPQDFPQNTNESTFKNVGKEEDIEGDVSRAAMGF